jgi:hypothetical protein
MEADLPVLCYKMPEWWNGIHGCLKSICPKGRAGSNPASGTRGAIDKTVGTTHGNGLMYPQSTVELAKLLSGLGTLDRENAEICGVSIASVRHWRRGDRRRRSEVARCPRCHARALDAGAYSYLPGLYLGDGHITKGRRGVYALPIKCCDAWPGLRDQARIALSAVMPTSSVFSAARIGCTEIKSTSKHWPCLFPQHGPGRKHEHKIELEPWQQEIVNNHLGDFARGLFHSDGCRLINRVRRPLKGGDRFYEYPRYLLSTCQPTYTGCAARRWTGSGWPGGSRSRPRSRLRGGEAVASLDEFVGPKY